MTVKDKHNLKYVVQNLSFTPLEFNHKKPLPYLYLCDDISFLTLLNALKTQQEDVVISILKKDPSLTFKLFNCLDHNFSIPDYVAFLAHNSDVAFGEITLNPVFYCLFTRLDKVLEYVFSNVDYKELVKNYAFFKKFSHFNLLWGVLLLDNPHYISLIGLDKLTKALKVSKDYLVDKVLAYSSKFEYFFYAFKPFGRCYPQKILHFLSTIEPQTIKLTKKNNLDYFELLTFSFDDKVLPEIIKQNPEITHVFIEQALSCSNTFKVDAVKIKKFNTQAFRKKVTLYLLKLHFSFHKSLPSHSTFKTTTPFLHDLLKIAKKENYKNIQYFIKTQEVQQQAQELYKKHFKIINLSYVLNLGQKGLALFDKLGITWEKKPNGSPSYLGHYFLSTLNTKVLSCLILTPVAKKKAEDFVLYCLKHKPYLFEQKLDNQSYLNYLEKLEMKELVIQIEKQLLSKDSNNHSFLKNLL